VRLAVLKDSEAEERGSAYCGAEQPSTLCVRGPRLRIPSADLLYSPPQIGHQSTNGLPVSYRYQLGVQRDDHLYVTYRSSGARVGFTSYAPPTSPDSLDWNLELVKESSDGRLRQTAHRPGVRCRRHRFCFRAQTQTEERDA